MVNINIDKLLKKWLPRFLKSIKIDYSIGSAVGITNAKRSGKQTNINPINMTKKDQKLFIETIETQIKDINSDIAKKIGYLTNKSITEKWSTDMLVKEIDKLDIPKLYKNRSKTIAQNTSFDIMSTGSHKTAERLNAKGKWIFNTMDNKTADDSKKNDIKYGTPEQAIPMNAPFKYNWKGEERVFMYGRDRVNDRSQTMYIFE